ncbi:MAG: antitermination protein NusG [Pseudomonadota bacterium]|nr:antitermination protein NusG [Pseudomonadota bacterium]
MISKLLLTAAVIAGFVLYLRYSGAQGDENDERSAAPRRSADPTFSQGLRIAVIILVAFMILGSGVYLYFEWQDRYRVVSVRVVNTRNGQSVSYEARRGDVGEKSFVTLDGLRVTPAETERIEMTATGDISR